MGRGRGSGRGRGRGQGLRTSSGASAPASKPLDVVQKARAFEEKARYIIDQLGAIARRITEIETPGTDRPAQIEAPGTDRPALTTHSETASEGTRNFGDLTAVIDPERCVCCGACVDFCPEQAISMSDTVEIDSSACTGCGSCVDECPNQAIALSETALRAAS